MAGPGDPDTSFAGNGKRTISFGGTDLARVVLVQPNGRIVVAGGGAAADSFCVARLGTNGALDTTFGPGGSAESALAVTTSRSSAGRFSRTARSCSRETRTCGSPSRA